MTILTFTSRENKINVQERKAMLWHLQLIKPKKWVLQICRDYVLIAELQNKTRYNKNIKSLSY